MHEAAQLSRLGEPHDGVNMIRHEHEADASCGVSFEGVMKAILERGRRSSNRSMRVAQVAVCG
jgi:hypothetical protein